MKLVRLLDLSDRHLMFAVQHKEEVMTPVGVVAPQDRTQRRRSKVSPVETRNAGEMKTIWQRGREGGRFYTEATGGAGGRTWAEACLVNEQV